MNRRAWFWVCGVTVGFLILTKTPLIFTVFAFLVLGMIPGTTLTIPAWVLLATYPVAFAGVIYWLSTQPLLIGSSGPGTPPRSSKKTMTKTKAAPKAIKSVTTKRPSRATT